MIILGIDPSLRRSGFGVIRMLSADRAEILDCGVINVPANAPQSECLRRLNGGMHELVRTYHPDQVSIESPFYGKNVKTAMILSMARGVIIAAMADSSIPVYAYSPSHAKRAVVGNGAATKMQVAAMIAARFKLDVSTIPDDATDALALALCHGQITMVPALAAMLPKPI